MNETSGGKCLVISNSGSVDMYSFPKKIKKFILKYGIVDVYLVQEMELEACTSASLLI